MCGRFALAPRYNIAPTSTLNLSTPSGPQQINWGFKNSHNHFLINCRSDNKFYKQGYCVLEMDGYYEWINEQPYYITSKTGKLLVGCVSRNDGFLIVTTESGKNISKIHDRMPVILRNNHLQWINCKSFQDALKLISSKDDDLVYWPVGKLVNSVKSHGKELIEAVKLNKQPKISSFFKPIKSDPKPVVGDGVKAKAVKVEDGANSIGENEAEFVNLDDESKSQAKTCRDDDYEIDDEMTKGILSQQRTTREEYPIDEDLMIGDFVDDELIGTQTLGTLKRKQNNDISPKSVFKTTKLAPRIMPIDAKRTVAGKAYKQSESTKMGLNTKESKMVKLKPPRLQ